MPRLQSQRRSPTEWDVLAFIVATYSGLVVAHGTASFLFDNWPGVLGASGELFFLGLFLYWLPTLGWTAEFLIVWLLLHRLRRPASMTRRVLAASLAALMTPAALLTLDAFIWGNETLADRLLLATVVVLPLVASAVVLPLGYLFRPATRPGTSNHL